MLRDLHEFLAATGRVVVCRAKWVAPAAGLRRRRLPNNSWPTLIKVARTVLAKRKITVERECRHNHVGKRHPVCQRGKTAHLGGSPLDQLLGQPPAVGCSMSKDMNFIFSCV